MHLFKLLILFSSSFCFTSCDFLKVLYDLPTMASKDLKIAFADMKQSETYKTSRIANYDFTIHNNIEKLFEDVSIQNQFPKNNITQKLNEFSNNIKQQFALNSKSKNKVAIKSFEEKFKKQKPKEKVSLKKTKPSKPKPIKNNKSIKIDRSTKIATQFTYPVGFPSAKGYYIAQTFGVKNGHFNNKKHLGDDWNAVTGGNTDKGDPVYTIATGYVSESFNAGNGWGNIVRVIHKLPNGKFVESLYAHLNQRMVQAGDFIYIGQQVGTIGDAGGSYYAHLHLELRAKPGLPLGGGYANSTDYYLNPKKFIDEFQRYN